MKKLRYSVLKRLAKDIKLGSTELNLKSGTLSSKSMFQPLCHLALGCRNRAHLLSVYVLDTNPYQQCFQNYSSWMNHVLGMSGEQLNIKCLNYWKVLSGECLTRPSTILNSTNRIKWNFRPSIIF